MVIGRLKTVGYKVGLRFETWIKIQGCGRIQLVVLKVPGEYLDNISNFTQKIFDLMRHGGLVLGRRIIEFLPELLHIEEKCLGFVGHMSSEEGNGPKDFFGNSFEYFSWVN